MKFAVVLPAEKRITVVDVPDLRDAIRRAGLEPGAVDHGHVFRGLGVVVGEHGLYVPPAEQSYFSISRRLYAGNAVLYATNDAGDTVDYDHGGRWFGEWFDDAAGVEVAVAAGRVERPTLAVGADVVWRWPEPRPDLDAAVDKIADSLVSGKTVVVDGDVVLINLDREGK